MAMPTVSGSDISELRNTIEKLNNTVNTLNTQMLLHNSHQEPLELLVGKHEIQLNGDGQKIVGLVQMVASIDKTIVSFLGNLERAIWVIVAAVLTGVGVALVEVFKAGLR